MKAAIFCLAASAAILVPVAASASVILPNGQNCDLPATIDKSMRAECAAVAQHQKEQAKSLSVVEPAAGEATSQKHSRRHKYHRKHHYRHHDAGGSANSKGPSGAASPATGVPK